MLVNHIKQGMNPVKELKYTFMSNWRVAMEDINVTINNIIRHKQNQNNTQLRNNIDNQIQQEDVDRYSNPNTHFGNSPNSN